MGTDIQSAQILAFQHAIHPIEHALTPLKCHEEASHPSGLEADVIAARATDVLVGTHGAGLTNAFFMQKGSALVEARRANPAMLRDRTPPDTHAWPHYPLCRLWEMMIPW